MGHAFGSKCAGQGLFAPPLMPHLRTQMRRPGLCRAATYASHSDPNAQARAALRRHSCLTCGPRCADRDYFAPPLLLHNRTQRTLSLTYEPKCADRAYFAPPLMHSNLGSKCASQARTSTRPSKICKQRSSAFSHKTLDAEPMSTELNTRKGVLCQSAARTEAGTALLKFERPSQGARRSSTDETKVVERPSRLH